MVPPGGDGSGSESSRSNRSEQRTTTRTRILAWFIKWIPSEKFRRDLWRIGVFISLTSAAVGITAGITHTVENKRCLVCWAIGVLGAATSVCLFGITYESAWDKILAITIFLNTILAVTGISSGVYNRRREQNCLDCWLMGGIPLTIVFVLCFIFHKKILEALRGNVQVHPQPPEEEQPPGVNLGPLPNGAAVQMVPAPLPNGVAVHMVPPGELGLEQQEEGDNPPLPNGNAVILEPLQPEVPEPQQENLLPPHNDVVLEERHCG